MVKAAIRVPADVRKSILSAVTGLSGDMWETVDNLLTHRMVDNFLTMGSGEITAVPRDQNRVAKYLRDISVASAQQGHQEGQTSGCGKRIMFLYTDHDIWAPSEDGKFFSRLIPNAHVVQSISHSH